MVGGAPTLVRRGSSALIPRWTSTTSPALNGVLLLRSVVVMHVGPADALSLLVQDPKVNDVRRYARFLHQRSCGPSEVVDRPGRLER